MANLKNSNHKNLNKTGVKRKCLESLSEKCHNPGQNIWQKVKGYEKGGQDFKNIISNFACFLTAIVNV